MDTTAHDELAWSPPFGQVSLSGTRMSFKSWQVAKSNYQQKRQFSRRHLASLREPQRGELGEAPDYSIKGKQSFSQLITPCLAALQLVLDILTPEAS